MKQIFSLKFTTLILFVVGTVLRINHYVQNKSLWLDEAWHALDVAKHSFWDFLFGSHFAVSLLIGFVFLAKISILFLGNNEYAFG